MKSIDLFDCINFFNDLSIKVSDITTEADKQNENKVVLAEYSYKGNTYTTNPLYYKEISNLDNVRDPHHLHMYFGEEVYWLDIDKHPWPQGSGESDLDELVVNDMTNHIDFKTFLLSLANNDQNGFIQRITKDGRSGQYYHNLENNNHWHDLVLFIKEVIKNKGSEIDRVFFQHLIFNWDKGKRKSLDAGYPYKIVKDLYRNILEIQTAMSNEKLELLQHKKQIILQGPPGTGKTREAKKIAEQLVGLNKLNSRPEKITDNDVASFLKIGMTVSTVAGDAEYEIIEINSDRIVSKKKSGNIDETLFKNIILAYNENLWDSVITSNPNRRAKAFAKAIYDSYKVNTNADSDQIRIIQFHPSYTYEDFVRGIETNSNGTQIEYKNTDKVLAKFAKKALDNYKDSIKDSSVISYELQVRDAFEKFKDDVADALTILDKQYSLTDKVSLIDIEEDAFRYKGKTGWSSKGNRMLFSDIVQAYISQNNTRQDIVNNKLLSGLARWHASYFVRVVEMFRNFIEEKKITFNNNNDKIVELKKFVLIVDEINRANLSSVLGELIYALEYRGKAVESMYAVDEDNKLVLPTNLYIIGTMNTADRSVGHIDYAIRRRFAFVDMLPKNLISELKSDFFADHFATVASLFIKDYNPSLDYNNEFVTYEKSDHLTNDFDPKDVWLGHSYFIQQYENKEKVDFNLRIKYEIKPILLEYIKDGILKGSAREIINKIGINA